jgi:hypothetical protein
LQRYLSIGRADDSVVEWLAWAICACLAQFGDRFGGRPRQRQLLLLGIELVGAQRWRRRGGGGSRRRRARRLPTPDCASRWAR